VLVASWAPSASAALIEPQELRRRALTSPRLSLGTLDIAEDLTIINATVAQVDAILSLANKTVDELVRDFTSSAGALYDTIALISQAGKMAARIPGTDAAKLDAEIASLVASLNTSLTAAVEVATTLPPKISLVLDETQKAIADLGNATFGAFLLAQNEAEQVLRSSGGVRSLVELAARPACPWLPSLLDDTVWRKGKASHTPRAKAVKAVAKAKAKAAQLSEKVGGLKSEVAEQLDGFIDTIEDALDNLKSAVQTALQSLSKTMQKLLTMVLHTDPAHLADSLLSVGDVLQAAVQASTAQVAGLVSAAMANFDPKIEAILDKILSQISPASA